MRKTVVFHLVYLTFCAKKDIKKYYLKPKKGKYNMAKKPTVSQEDARLEALKTALSTIEKKYGQGAVMKLSDSAHVQVPVIPTGSIGLDLALGIGGVPKGRVTEIYGPESSGKTTLTLHIIAECQKQGGTAAFIDAEHALDTSYAARLGVKVDELLISQPDHGEQALDIADMLVRSGAVDLVVIDSVAALIPQSELEGNMGETQVGGHARLMSHALRKLTGTIHKSKTCVIFINQIRMKIGMMGYGSPETTTGGNALKFYASVRIDIRPGNSIKDGDNVFGKHAKIKVVKNKVAPPFKRCEFDIMFGEGISKAGEIVDLGVEYDIIQKSGSWFSYNGSKLAQGRDAAKQVILDNPELAEELEEKIMEALNSSPQGGKAAKGKKPSKDTDDSEAPASKSAGADADDDLDLDLDDDLDDDFTLEEDM